METWKAFEANEITHSGAHHLMAIAELRSSRGYARVTDVAKHLSITRGSASITLKALKEKGLVVEDDNKFLDLSETGHHLAQTVLSRRKVLIEFMEKVLRIDHGLAEVDACKIEHLVSTETGGKLLHFLRFLTSNEPEAQDFLKSFWEQDSDHCDMEDCPVCESSCMLKELEGI